VNSDLNAAAQWVDEWQSSIEERAARARTLSDRVAGMRVSARSRDDLVEVTVDSTGAVVDLRLDERIRDRPATDISQAILAVMRAAQAELAPLVRRAADEEFGADDPTADAIVTSYTRRFSPPPDSEAG
jgi:DNA-binding protein YbaB